MPDRNMPQQRQHMTHRGPLPSTSDLDLVLLDLIEEVIVGLLVELDALIGEGAKPASKPCLIARALIDIPDPYKNVLATLVDTTWKDGGFTDDEVAARMKAAGLRSSATSVRLHRRGYCSCR